MERDGLPSGSHRSGSGRRGERSSSSTQGFFAAKVGNERDGFNSCCLLYVQIKHNHCNFFLWLDQHLAKFGKMEDFKGAEDEEDVNKHFSKMKLEIRLGDLEERVSAIEKKKRMHVFLIVLGIAVVLLSICVSKV
ncbi:hypothetical protein PIB30_022233 [Stylosanthes scabra]|uniref:Uncharacterized protein n=1 Tax=Stylosanthes scabra TaxID=79078 RepID=A0ABU6Q912_9FABA|nr:hypothetical protein [Stylosanthes scabra]